MCSCANGRFEFELCTWFVRPRRLKLWVSRGQPMEHGLGPFSRADLHPSRNPLSAGATVRDVVDLHQYSTRMACGILRRVSRFPSHFKTQNTPGHLSSANRLGVIYDLRDLPQLNPSPVIPCSLSWIRPEVCWKPHRLPPAWTGTSGGPRLARRYPHVDPYGARRETGPRDTQCAACVCDLGSASKLTG